jgi:hypothetical protein
MQLATKGSAIRILVVAALVGGFFLYKFARNVSPGLKGSVTQFGSDKPVSDSTIVLTCHALTGYGEDKKTTTSDDDGEFSFSRGELEKCNGEMTVEARKTGYQDVQLIGKGLEAIEFRLDGTKRETHLELIADSDVTQTKLDMWKERALGSPQPDWRPGAHASYNRIAKSLKESMKIATTAEEKRWVREQYCERITSLWAELEPQEQTYQFGALQSPEDLAESCS